MQQEELLHKYTRFDHANLVSVTIGFATDV
jgi:hypothetical protein